MRDIGIVLRASIWTYLASIVYQICGLAFWVIISVFSSISTLGNISAIVALSNLLVSVSSLGLGVGLLKCLGEAFAKQNRHACSRIVGVGLTYVILIALIESTILLLLAFSGVRIGNYTSIHFLFSILLIVPLLFNIVLIPTFYASFKTFKYFLAVFVGNFTKIILVLIFILFRILNLVTIFLAYACSILITVFVLLLYMPKIVNPILNFDIRLLRLLISIGISQWLPNTIIVSVQNITVSLLFTTHGSLSTGLYYVAYIIAGSVLGFALSVQHLMLPYLSGIEHDRARYAWTSLKISLCIVMPVISTLLIYSKDVLSLLGLSYAKVWPVLDILLIAQILWIGILCINNLLYSHNMQSSVLKINTCIAITQVILLIILIRKLSSIGAGIATLVGNLVGLIVSSLHYARIVNFSVDKRFIRIILVVVQCVIVLSLLFQFLMPNPTLRLVSAIVPIVLGYLIILKLKLVTKSELATILSIIPSKIRLKIAKVVFRLLGDVTYEISE